VDDLAPPFGQVLRDLRNTRGYSLREFAVISHHSKSLLSKWETGGGVPQADVVEELDHLLGGEGRLVDAAIVPVQPTVNRLISEVTRRYAHQDAVEAEIRRRATGAKQLDVLAVRGLGLLALNDSLLRPALTGRTAPLRVRVLLLDPDCEAAAQRAREIRESPPAFAAGIKLTIARLEELAAAESGLTVEVGLYARLPIWRIIRVDETLWVSTFAAGWEGHESTTYEVPQTPRGALWSGYCRTFDDLHANSRRVV
jgi:transcriptional regulator with XRE-family HTH domain